LSIFPKTFQHQPLLLQSRFNRELSISAMFTDQKSLEICYGKMMGLQTQYLFRNLNGMRECENITTWDLRVNILCEAHACTSILNGASGCIHGRVPSRF
jgi:hypothetical protein